MDFLEHNPLYVVGIIAAVIWLGIFFFLFSLERRVKRLESEGSPDMVRVRQASPKIQ